MIGRQTSTSYRIGPYIVIEPLDASTPNKVFKCRHGQTGMLAAVKIALASNDDHCGRLRNEARVLARLNRSRHPGVVELLDTGTLKGAPWLALAYVPGPALASICHALSVNAHGPYPLSPLIRLGRCVAEAVAHVHAHGIVHGSLSPQNILLKAGEQPVLIHFEMASDTSRENVDRRSDLYALGHTLYELFVGEPPIRTARRGAQGHDQPQLEPCRPSSLRAGLPRELDDLILALLRKGGRERLDRAEDVANALANVSLATTGGSRPPKVRDWKLRPSRLIGRDSALERLVAGLDAAVRKRGGVFLVAGASGIGKSRLLNDLILQAREFRVMFGRCTPLSQDLVAESTSAGLALEAFLPFLRWLADYRQEHNHSLPAELSAAVAVLSSYEPDLAAVLSPFAIPTLTPALARSRVLRSLLDALLRTSTERPLLLVIDDLQWADDLTLSFLTGGHRSALELSNVLIVAAYRTEELDAQLFEADVRRVELTPLAADEIGLMATEMLGTSLVPAGLAELLHHHSEGNPFFAVEYLQAFIECALLAQTPSGEWQLSELHRRPLTVAIPSSLQDLFALRLTGLSIDARQTLELASILGREFRSDVLAILRDEPSNAALDQALEELVARQILESCKPAQYRFVHDRLREAQRCSIPDTRRHALHRKVAEALEIRNKSAHPSISRVELGLHWAEAGEPVKAAAYLEGAAEQAAAQHGIADAASLYALAIEQVELVRKLLPDDLSWGSRKLALAESRGDLLGWSARHAEACAQYQAVLPLVPPEQALLRARLERKTGKAYWTLHDYENAELALHRAATSLGDAGNLSDIGEFREWIDIQQNFFWLHYFARRPEAFTGPSMRRMADVVERHGTTAQKSMFYECAACHAIARDRYRYSGRAAALARRANTELCTEPEHLAQAAEARFTLAFILLQGTPSQCQEAIALFELNLQTLTPVGEATLLARSLLYLAICHRRVGDVTAAQAVAKRARRSAERARLVPYIGASLGCEAWARWRLGDTVAARQMAEQACAWWSKAPHAFPFQWLAKLVLLDLHCISADFTAASAVISELLHPEQQQLPKELDAALLACAVSLRIGAEADTARAKLEKVLALAHQHSYL